MNKPNTMARLVFLKWLPRGLGACGAVLVLFMMLLTFLDVVGRYFFSYPIKGSYELTEVLLAFVVFFALPLVTLGNEHVTVSLFDGWFSGRAKKVRNLLINLMMVLVQAVVSWRLWLQATDMLDYGDVSLFLRIPYGWVAYAMAVLVGLSAVFSLYLLAVNLFQTKGTTQVTS